MEKIRVTTKPFDFMPISQGTQGGDPWAERKTKTKLIYDKDIHEFRCWRAIFQLPCSILFCFRQTLAKCEVRNNSPEASLPRLFSYWIFLDSQTKLKTSIFEMKKKKHFRVREWEYFSDTGLRQQTGFLWQLHLVSL